MLDHPFSFSKGDLAVLGPVVKALLGAVLDVWHDLLLRRAVRAQLVGDYALGPLVLTVRSSWAGWCGRALIWEKPICFSSLPIVRS